MLSFQFRNRKESIRAKKHRKREKEERRHTKKNNEIFFETIRNISNIVYLKSKENLLKIHLSKK